MSRRHCVALYRKRANEGFQVRERYARAIELGIGFFLGPKGKGVSPFESVEEWFFSALREGLRLGYLCERVCVVFVFSFFIRTRGG